MRRGKPVAHNHFAQLSANLQHLIACNKRVIKAYQKAGFLYVETIQNEIAFSDYMEDFWVMEL